MRVDPNYTNTLVSSLDNVTSLTQSLTNELSSGKRVNSISDDPVAASKNVVLLNEIQQDDTFTSTATTVTGTLQVADSTLGDVVTQLTSAISQATSANNGTLNSTQVKNVATQLTSILAEVTTLANTSYQGQYIFAGSDSSTAPFSTTSTSSSSTTTYNGDSNVNYLTTPGGAKIQLNVPGDQVFLGSGSNSVFGALNALISDYSSGTVNTTTAAKDTAALNTALNYVSSQRVTIDDSINQVTAASDAASSEVTQLTTEQTNLLQADTADVATKLSTAETQSTALEDVIAELDSSSNSLFSKINS